MEIATQSATALGDGFRILFAFSFVIVLELSVLIGFQALR